MNRMLYFNNIEEKLICLACRIKSRGQLNLLELNIHSENFYRDLFNLIFDYQLENQNKNKTNTPGIDLIDNKNKLIIQVSSTATYTKIQNSLQKSMNYSGYHFKFISITNEPNNLTLKNYEIPLGIIFEPKEDIFDVNFLLKIIQNLTTVKLRQVYELIQQELTDTERPNITDSNLTKIINLIAEIDWSENQIQTNSIPFDIEDKIIFNKMSALAETIKDYSIHHFRITNIYQAFDQEGKNKSYSVLNALKGIYLRNKNNYLGDILFDKIIEEVKNKIINSRNYQEMPDEELELYVTIIVVDAFVRCKIFENPLNTNANTR